MNEILAELIAKGVDMNAIAEQGRHVGVPMELMQVLFPALEHDRAKRYQSVNEMLERIRRIQDGQVLVSCHVTAFKRAAYEAIHWVDRNPHAYSLMILCLVMTILAGFGVGAYHFIRAL